MTERQETETIEGVRVACPGCGAFRWCYVDDRDNGDWCEAVYDCAACGRREYVELAD